MANVLSLEKQIRVVAALTEGNAVRAVARQVECDKNTVLSLGLRVGEGCARLHDRLVRGLASTVIQGDETWSFIQKKEARTDPTKDPPEHGDAYTWIALDAIVKLVISYHVGKRDAENADAFARDLRSRLTVVPHLSTDGFNAYPAVIAAHFQGAIDYGTAVKHYRTGSQRGPDHRYEPPPSPGASAQGANPPLPPGAGGSGANALHIIGGASTAVTPPGQTRATMINLQDYRILTEGAGNPRDASTRDVCYGVAVSAFTTAASLFSSVDLDKNTGPIKLFLCMAFASGAALIIAVLAHLRTRDDKGRKSYAALIARMRAEVGGEKD